MKTKTLIIITIAILLIAAFLFFKKKTKDASSKELENQEEDTSEYADIADMTYNEVINFIKSKGLQTKSENKRYFYEITDIGKTNLPPNKSQFCFSYVDWRETWENDWINYNISKNTFEKLKDAGYEVINEDPLKQP